jgi:hypothetical protein
MNWRRQESIISLPSGLQASAKALSQIASSALTVPEALREVLQGSAVLAANLDASQLALQAAAAALKAAAEDLTKDTGLYVLLVPPARRTAIPDRVKEAMGDLGLASFPLSPTRLGDFVTSSALPAETMAFLTQASSAQGGSAAFMRLVAAAISDEGDPNRPQFTGSEFVTGLVLLAGASDLQSLGGTLRFLHTVFDPLASSGTFVAPGVIVPQNLRARVVAGATRPAVLLEWEPHEPAQQVKGLDTWSRIHQVAVLRSSSPALLEARSVASLFGGAEIRAGQQAGPVTVTGISEVDPVHPERFQTNYRDEDPALVLGDDYFYAVAYAQKWGTYLDLMTGGGTDTGFEVLSSVERVHYEDRFAGSAKSTPPDWVRTPSVFGLVPRLRGYLTDLLLSANQWSSVASGYSSLLQTAASWLGTEIDKFEALTADMAGALQVLSALAGSRISTGIYARGFESSTADVNRGLGGVNFLLSDLAKALSAEAGRPPFDRGDEYVAGLVLLAGGPSLAALAPVKTALGLLFGTSSDANAITAAAAQIAAVVEQAERALGDDLLLLPALASPSPTAATSPTAGPGDGPVGVLEITPASDVPAIGAADTGNCSLLKRTTPAQTQFGPNLTPTT